MRRLSPLFLVVVAASAQAADGLPNPLAMLVPMGNPMAGYGAPFGGGYGNPYGNPIGNLLMPGYGNPLGSLSTLSALASLGAVAAPLVAPLAPSLLGGPVGQMGYPAMQMAPNMMSYGHYNQYGGGMFGGNPYLQRSLPNPLAPPAFSPSVPTLPFTPSQGTLPLPFGAGPTAAPAPVLAPAPAANPLALLPLLSSPGMMAPPPGLMPGLAPAAPMAPASQTNPWAQALNTAEAPAAKPASPTPVPYPLNPWMLVAPPVVAAPKEPVAAPKPEPAPAAAVDAPALPMDPAAFLQMLMKPMEGASQAVGVPPAAR